MSISYNIKFLINKIGLLLIVVFSLCYINFGSKFAEINLKLSFLPFPIFIGEILIFICLILLFLNHLNKFIKLNIFTVTFFLYSFFVISKAILGYEHYGALAFRHAALFYYPIFVLFGYFFYDNNFLKESEAVVLTIFFIVIFILNTFDHQWMFSCFILSLVFIYNIRQKTIKYFLFFLLILSIPYLRFFRAPSMSMLSNAIAFIFLIVSFLSLVCFKNKYKILIFLTCFFVILIGFICFSDPVELSSIFNLRGMHNIFMNRDSVVQKYKNVYITQDFGPTVLYNPENEDIFSLKEKISSNSSDKQENINTKKGDREIDKELQKRSREYSLLRQTINREISIANENCFKENKGSISGMTNAVFRIFIWRDALEDLIKYKPIFGFDFGKPFRSISLEIYNWGISEWSRDGWVSMHNSYLDLIYRAGIIGIIFIIFIARLFIKMVAICYSHKTYKGLVLCSIILNWLIAAFFLSKFELPYTAIPFWTIFGMTYAYLRSIENNQHRSKTSSIF